MILDHPWQGSPVMTQDFGLSTVDEEPAGYIWPDGSVTYHRDQWATLHNHVHCGIDLGLPSGSPLHAPADGRTILAGWDDTGFGNCIELDHGRLAITTLYGHLQDLLVKHGQLVKKGQLIGHTNNTGNSSGPHLHFSVIRQSDGHFVDPKPYLVAAPKHVPQPKPANDGITYQRFTVKTKPEGLTRVFDGPSTRLVKLATEQPGVTLTCDAWTHGEPREDWDTKKLDPLWFHLALAGGWVPSAHTIGYPPGVTPP